MSSELVSSKSQLVNATATRPESPVYYTVGRLHSGVILRVNQWQDANPSPGVSCTDKHHRSLPDSISVKDDKLVSEKWIARRGSYPEAELRLALTNRHIFRPSYRSRSFSIHRRYRRCNHHHHPHHHHSHCHKHHRCKKKPRGPTIPRTIDGKHYGAAAPYPLKKTGDKLNGAEESGRHRLLVFVIGAVAVFIIVTCFLLVGATLSLSPTIDAMVRKENEELLRGRVLVTSGPEVKASNQTVTSTVKPD